MTCLRKVTGNDGFKRLAYWCQGCDSCHVIRIQENDQTPHPCWTWDGNVETPTFSPSVKVTSSSPRSHFVCHTYVTKGMVQFLPDCTHQFAGQTLPLPPWPYADGEYGGVEPL